MINDFIVRTTQQNLITLIATVKPKTGMIDGLQKLPNFKKLGGTDITSAKFFRF